MLSPETERGRLATGAPVMKFPGSCPPPAHLNLCLSHKRSSQAREEIVVFGSNAYTNAIHRMMDTIGRELP